MPRAGPVETAAVKAGEHGVRTRRLESPLVEPDSGHRRQDQRAHATSLLRLLLLRLLGSPRGPVVSHPFGDRLALLLRHRTLPFRDRLARLLRAAAGDRRRIPFYRLDCTLNGNELAPERLLLVP